MVAFHEQTKKKCDTGFHLLRMFVDLKKLFRKKNTQKRPQQKISQQCRKPSWGFHWVFYKPTFIQPTVHPDISMIFHDVVFGKAPLQPMEVDKGPFVVQIKRYNFDWPFSDWPPPWANFAGYTPEIYMEPQKWRFGRWFPFSNRWFSKFHVNFPGCIRIWFDEIYGIDVVLFSVLGPTTSYNLQCINGLISNSSMLQFQSTFPKLHCTWVG